MRRTATAILLSVAALVATAVPFGAASAATGRAGAYRVLVYSKTAGYRHDSIVPGIRAIRRLGREAGFTVDATEDPAAFTNRRLAAYAAVVFLSTTGDVVPQRAQRAALERYVRRGGGWVGIHAATDMGDMATTWPWYRGLVGAVFRTHPAVMPAVVRVEDRRAWSTAPLPRRWSLTDEWYAFQADPRPHVHVLLTLDESTYLPGPGAMGPLGPTGAGLAATDHPIAWCRRYRGGRAIYTALGHTTQQFAQPQHLTFLRRSIQMAAGRASFGRC